MDLRYGMKVMFPCHPLEFAGLIPGLAFTSSTSPEVMVEMEVTKYWENDTDPNSYKVILVPVNETDKFAFGKQKLYSTDLKVLIERGTVTVKGGYDEVSR